MARKRLSSAPFLVLLLASMAVPALLRAHDLQTKIEWRPPFVLVTAAYEGLEAASFAEVTVQAPESANLKSDAFQTGHTDYDGKFVFLPPSPGDWRVIVDDEMGHRVEAIAAVPHTSGVTSPQSAAPSQSDGRSVGDRLLIGLSILFGAAGLLYGWTARRGTRTA
ncbi:MAG: hypothetical protein LC114_21525 [Bryobacterales bacterium]|nr:hypothetical protein [Bryobacterales bacterium]